MMLAAPPQSLAPEIEMMGAGIIGSRLSDCLDVPDDHLLAQQQAGLDNETLQLVQMLAALSEQTHYLRARRDMMTALQVTRSQHQRCNTCCAHQITQTC